MFTKDKVIDKNKIQEAVEYRKLLTYEALKQDWDDFCKTSEEMGSEQKASNDFSFYELYDICFSTSLFGLSLDELEYIRDNNLFDFDDNNILDYRCKKNIDRKINNYRKILDDLNNAMQKANIGSYFQAFSSIFDMSAQGLKITTMLGLNRGNVILTPEGEKLKKCIDNIDNILKGSNSQGVDTLIK